MTKNLDYFELGTIKLLTDDKIEEPRFSIQRKYDRIEILAIHVSNCILYYGASECLRAGDKEWQDPVAFNDPLAWLKICEFVALSTITVHWHKARSQSRS